MKQYHYPVAFTGAGISVASGLPTFDITWNGIPVRDLLTTQYFSQDPAGFYEMFREVEKWRDAPPNPAHYALAEAEIPVVTQNVVPFIIWIWFPRWKRSIPQYLPPSFSVKFLFLYSYLTEKCRYNI